MSGGGSVPNAPDLSTNSNNANATYGTATSQAGQTFNTALGYNANAQSNLNKTLNIGNSSAGALLDNAKQNLGTYSSVFSPLQKQQADMASNYASDANTQRLQGRAVADQNQAVQAARQNSAAALASEGVDPASVHGAALDRQTAVTGAANAAGAGTNSAIQTQLTGNQLVAQANQLGLGVGQEGTSAATAATGAAATGQQVANQTNATGVANMTADTGLLNTGINANKSAADISSQDFSNQMTAYNAKQAQSAGTGQIIGDVAGVAAMAMMESGGVVPQPTQGIPTSYGNGGNVTTKGALPVSPIPGSTDTKPALLTPGEFVMPKDVVDFKGQDYFHRQIDSIRKQKNKRQAIPTNHPPHIQMVH